MNKSKSRALRLFYTAFSRLLAASAAAFAIFAATPSIAQEAGASSEEVVEEIVVLGIRGSLRRSLATKRSSISLVDGISSDDIADFPGYNITEERVLPGTDAGETQQSK
ncbi:MAG: hypothetical protein IIB77_06045 [Proteobacteria bacterium]|nr:hypothetical protein [Pseudomonadota bacterium]